MIAPQFIVFFASNASALLAAELHTESSLTVRLQTGPALAAPFASSAAMGALLQTGVPLNVGADLAARSSFSASLSTGTIIAAPLASSATLGARMEAGVLVAAAPIARASLAGNLQIGAGLAVTLAPVAAIAATLQTAYFVSSYVTARAGLSADLAIGMLLGVRMEPRSTLTARLHTRKQFPAEAKPGADAPRARQYETLDALIWRVTGQRSIEAVLAANPGLADLGEFLPEGHAVDLTTASESTVLAAGATRELVQLWD